MSLRTPRDLAQPRYAGQHDFYFASEVYNEAVMSKKTKKKNLTALGLPRRATGSDDRRYLIWKCR